MSEALPSSPATVLQASPTAPPPPPPLAISAVEKPTSEPAAIPAPQKEIPVESVAAPAKPTDEPTTVVKTGIAPVTPSPTKTKPETAAPAISTEKSKVEPLPSPAPADTPIPKRAMSVPSNLADSATPIPGPKKTFTLPTGEALTVVHAAPTSAPPLVEEKSKLIPIVEPLLNVKAAEPPTTVIVVEKEKAPEKLTPATASPTPVVIVEKEKVLSPVPIADKILPVVPSTTAVIAAPAILDKPQEVILLPAEPIKKVELNLPVDVVETPVVIIDKPASIPIVPVVEIVGEKKPEPAAAPVTLVLADSTMSDKSSAPTLPMMTPAITPTPATVVIPQETYRVGTLEPLNRKVVIFPNYVAQTSTILRFSDKFHHELLDASGHAIFHLHHRHHLIDEHGHLVACVHKSLFYGR